MKYWTIVGNEFSLEMAVSKQVWGLIKYYTTTWQKIDKGDILIFYCKNPISGIIGYGQVTKKITNNELIWVDEISENKSIYPNKIYFKTCYALPIDDWQEKRIIQKGLYVRRGLNYLKTVSRGKDSLPCKELIHEIDEKMKSLWNINFK